MEEKLRHKLKINKVREMKNPVIIMNEKDFEIFKSEIEAKVHNFKVGEYPSYEAIPIKVKGFIEQGNIIIYDDVKKFL